MIYKIIFLSFFILFSSCNKQEEKNDIVEENNLCICTRDYRPVCGKDGKTYGNPCEANCEKVEYTEGECPK